jgi:hypothetical protein
MPRIVISYRREDSGVITGRIFDRLVARYGREAIFRDIDNVPFGVDFRTHIDQVLGASDVVVAVVGPQWAGPPASPSRLGNSADPVRVEIETALRKGAPLIPVLVFGAAMPAGDQLPESLKDFAYRNAVQLDAGQDFDVHMARLIRAVDGILGLTVEVARASADEATTVLAPSAPEKRRLVLIGASIAAVLGMATAAGWYFVLDRQKSLLPTDTATVAPKVAPPPATSAPSAPPTSPDPTVAQPSIDPEVLFWQTISASNNATDFEEYLRKYPQGQFAGFARNRIAALRPAPQPPSQEGEEQNIRARLNELFRGSGVRSASDTDLVALFEENYQLSRPDKPIASEINMCECEDSSLATYTIRSIQVLGPSDAVAVFDAHYGQETKSLKLTLVKQDGQWRIHDMSSNAVNSVYNLLQTDNNKLKPEVVFWQRIEKSDIAANFESYLRNFPQGKFADLARSRLATLRPPPSVSPAAPVPRDNGDTLYRKAQDAWARKDNKLAMQLEGQAAVLGYGRALADLGEIYESGLAQDGIPQNHEKSKEYCKKARDALRREADDGNIESAATLGKLLVGREHPCGDRNRKGAYPFLLKAGERGNRDAMYLLAAILLAPSYSSSNSQSRSHPDDMARDTEQGCRWLAKSIRAGGPITPPYYWARRQLDEAAESCSVAKREPGRVLHPNTAPGADPFAVQRRLQESWGRQ